MMGTPITDKSVSCFPIITPYGPIACFFQFGVSDRRTHLMVVMHNGEVQRAKPLIEVQVRRYRFLRQVERRGWFTDSHMYFFYISETSVSYHGDGCLKFFA